MERHTTLDWNEYQAFKEINNWANDNEEGTLIWISPSYPSIYPVAKAIVSEIFTYDNRKFLLNRNVILDINNSDVLDLANQLAKESKFTDSEELRKAPIILPDYSTEYWQGILEGYTNQIRQTIKGEDILAKDTTLRDSEKIIYRVTSLFGFVNYDYAYREAKEEGVVGKQQGSCSGGNSKSPFSIFSENGNVQAGEKSLDCTCPFCKTKVTAIISGGQIHCPNCGKSASYHC
jgi:hypothetical protein